MINIKKSYKLMNHRRSVATYSKLHPPRAPNSTLELKASVVLEKVVSIGELWKSAVMKVKIYHSMHMCVPLTWVTEHVGGIVFP